MYDQFNTNDEIKTNAQQYDWQGADHGEDVRTRTWTCGYPDVHNLMNTIEHLNT